MSYEFDAKSFSNGYFAFVGRHNSNSLTPDVKAVANLKALSKSFFQELVSHLVKKDIEELSILDWLSSKQSWTR